MDQVNGLCPPYKLYHIILFHTNVWKNWRCPKLSMLSKEDRPGKQELNFSARLADTFRRKVLLAKVCLAQIFSKAAAGPG